MLRRVGAIVLVLVLLGLAQAAPPGGSAPSARAVSNFVDYRVVQYELPKGSTQPWTLTTDGEGRVWFVEQASNQVGMYDSGPGSFTEYNITTPGASPQGIAVDGGGNVWFAEVQSSKLGELPSGARQIVEYGIPRGPSNIPCGPIGVTPESGRVWVTCEFSNQIDEFFPSSETFLQFDLPVAFSAPLQILFDSSGNFWFTAADSYMLGHGITSELTNGTANGIGEFAPVNETYVRTFYNPLLPGGHVVSSLSTPSQIALSPGGGTLWVTEHSAGSFDKYVIATKSLVKYFTSRPLSSAYPESLPNGIAVDNSGIVWIAEHYGNRIGRFDPSTEQLTEYQIPCCKGGVAASLYIALGLNGSVWFTEFDGDAIGELIPETGTAGPTLAISPSVEVIQPNAQTAIGVSVETPGTFSATKASLSVSGISPAGALANMSAKFAPEEVALVPGENSSSTLSLTPNSDLGPGSYYLTVTARILSDNVTEGVVLKVDVPGARSIPYWILYVSAGLSALVAVLLLVVAMTRSKLHRWGSAPDLDSGHRMNLQEIGRDAHGFAECPDNAIAT